MKTALTGPQLLLASRPRTYSRWGPGVVQPTVETVPWTGSTVALKVPSVAVSATGAAPGTHGGVST